MQRLRFPGRAGPMRLATVLLSIAVVAALWLEPRAADTHAGDDRPPSTSELIGLTRLAERLGEQVPTGRGVVVGHVEGLSDGGYMPREVPERFAGVRFTAVSDDPAESGHATATATVLYGPRGLAPGVREVHCFRSGHWIHDGLLRRGQSAIPRDPQPVAVFTHSWIAAAAGFDSVDTLRRIDFLIDRYDVVVVAGVNNNRSSAVPALVGSAYNAIAVGDWDGDSSGGYTTAEQAGRSKPDIVAPGGRTSFSTPVVTAAVARLIEAGREFDDPPNAAVIKAVLMAGARKPRGWRQAPGKPLDEHLGAGQLQVDKSYDMLMAGNTSAGAAPRYGWHSGNMATNDTAAFEIDSPDVPGEVSIVLTWHRRIAPAAEEQDPTAGSVWSGKPRMADLNLRLIRLDDSTDAQVVAESVSTIDNVEHIHLRSLPQGRYRIEVSRADDLDEPWSFAVAWRVEER